MDITILQHFARSEWNRFVAAHFPLVGAFLQSWEWGEFKKKIGIPITRFSIKKRGKLIGLFQLEEHTLPLGMTYGYAPRGPVLLRAAWDDESYAHRIFAALAGFFSHRFPRYLFVRFEPPSEKQFTWYRNPPFSIPPFYIQPRHNDIIPLAPTDEKLLAQFSRDLRHDIRASERRGITVNVAGEMDTTANATFRVLREHMSIIKGKDLYPHDAYFEALASTFPSFEVREEHAAPSLAVITAKHGEDPVAMHLLLHFAKTTTYLFGAAAERTRSKRAPSYLHWAGMRHARDLCMTHYDIGGVDERVWPTLTYFKRQFKGTTLSYVGSIDLVLQPLLYHGYRMAKRLQRITEKN